MKTHITLSIVSALVLLSTQSMGADTAKKEEVKAEEPLLAGDSLALKADEEKESGPANNVAEAFENGKIKGLLRYSGQHRDSNYKPVDSSDNYQPTSGVQAYSAIGGYLGYETAPLFYTSIGATFYTSNPLGHNPEEWSGLGGLKEPEGEDQKSYNVLGEAFIKIQTDNNLLKAGRQEIPNYKFVSLSNIRMTPYTHEGVIYENGSIEDLKLHLAYITSQKNRNAETFEGMVRSARVKTGCGEVDATGQCVNSDKKMVIRGDYDPANFDASGNYIGDKKSMPLIGLTYKQENWGVDLWNYYVTDFVNTVYLYGEYKMPLSEYWKLSFAGQYANQQDVGAHVAGTVDTWFYGLKAAANTSDGMLFFVSYNEVSYNENSYDGGTLFVRWGTPQMFNSFQVQDSELAGTKSLGVGAQFDLGALGILDSTVIRFRYANYDMPDDLWMRDARQDRSEATFDLRYSFTKKSGFGIFTQMDGLSIQFRIAYDDFKTDYDFVKYKELHGYNALDSVTDSFVDARLYIDYVF